MHRFWSDGRWNKITLAHGCYWKKCSFCDVSLDYIGRYDRPGEELVMQRIRALIAETDETGFHMVDEAAPPAGMRALARRLIDEKLTITWWGNIRFEKTFTPELCRAAGRLRLRRRQRRPGGGLRPAAAADAQGRHRRAGGQRDARVHRAGIMVHAYLMYGFPRRPCRTPSMRSSACASCSPPGASSRPTGTASRHRALPHRPQTAGVRDHA